MVQPIQAGSMRGLWPLIIFIALLLVVAANAQAPAEYTRMRCAPRASTVHGSASFAYDIRTMCLFPPACGHWVSMTAANVDASFTSTGPPLTRTITATGTTDPNQFLTLTFSPTTCQYSIGAPCSDIYIPPRNASTLWMDLEDTVAMTAAGYNALTGRNSNTDYSMFYGFDSAGNDIIADPGARSTAPFTDRTYLSNSISKALLTPLEADANACSPAPGYTVYVCALPYERDTVTNFCKLADSVAVQAQGGTYAVVCAKSTALLAIGYSCTVQNAAAALRATCYITKETLKSWYAEETNNAANPTQPQTWTNTTARFVANQCGTAPLVGTNFFDCRYPLVAAAPNNTIGFCDYAPDYSEIFVSCYGNCIHCISQHGPESTLGGTQCRPVGAETDLTDTVYADQSFKSGDLYLNCRFMQTKASLIALYAARAAYLNDSAHAGASTTFSCFDVYLSNSTYQLDTYTGEWVPAGSPIGDPTVLPPQRRLMGEGADAPSNSPEWQSDKEQWGSEGAAAPFYVGLAHHYLDRASREAKRVPYPRDRLRTSDRVTWMDGMHVLRPNYEVADWIPLPSASKLGFIRRTASTPDVLESGSSSVTASTSGTKHKNAWYRPRPVYRSLLHSLLPDSGHVSLTLGETLQSAHLLDHYLAESHPIFTHVQRLHSTQMAHKAMVQHFRKHQRALYAHRFTKNRCDPNRRHRAAACTPDRSAPHRGFSTKQSLIGRVVHVTKPHRPGRSSSFASYRDDLLPDNMHIDESNTWASTSLSGGSLRGRRLLTTFEADPLASYYAPVCTDILGACNNNQLHCSHYDKYYVFGRRNRNTFCSNNLVNSCHTPNQTRPLTYVLQCDAGPFSAPHSILCTYDQSDTQSCMYTCAINTPSLVLAAYPIPASMLLDASLDNTTIGANNVPYPFRCDYVMHTAESRSLISTSNSYWCVAPLEPIFAFPTNSTLDTRHTQICYNSDAGTRNYTLDCGVMRVFCQYQPDSGNVAPLYTCNGTLLFIEGISSKLTTAWRTEDVPVDWLIPNSRWNDDHNIATTMDRCVALRDRTRTLMATQPASKQIYGCTKSADAGYIRLFDDASAVCTVLYDASGSISTGGLKVPLVQCPYSGILINCTFVPIVDESRNIYTGRFVCRTDLDPRSTRNVLLTNTHQFAMACTAIDPLLLQSYGVTFMRTDGGVQRISTTDSRLAVLSQDACMFIKRNCETPYQDYFGCNERLAQDSSRNEFCDISSAPEPVEFPVFTCGTQPTHAIFCSNHNTARIGWVRCQNVLPTDWVRPVNVTLERLDNIARSTQVLTMDCSISIGVMRALQYTWLQANPQYNNTATPTGATMDWLSKPDMCDQVRILCGFQPTTLAVIPVLDQINSAIGSVVFDLNSDLGQINALASSTIGSAASYLSSSELLFDPNDNPQPANNTFSCVLPAQYCTGVYCQVSNSTVLLNDTFTSQSTFFMSDRPYATPNSTSDTALLPGQCRPIVPVYKMMCQGVPISCTLGTATAQGLSFSSYRCASTHTTLNEIAVNAAASGFARPYVSQDGLGCSVSMDLFQQIESPTTLCMALGAQCVAQNGVSCVSGFTPTTEAPFCTLRSSANPGNPMFECSDLAVSCEWDPLHNWMFCTNQPGSAVWTIGSLFATPTRSDGRTGCVITSSTSNLASSSNVVRFYQNVEQRCSLLDQLCKVTCSKGYATRYVNVTQSDGVARLVPQFCEPLAYSSALTQTFRCDTQGIECSFVSSNRTRSASIPVVDSGGGAGSVGGGAAAAAYVDDTPLLSILYKADADYGRSHRMWQCRNQSAALATFPDSMQLDCAVSGAMLQYATDSCSAILGGCRTNGTLQCLGNYRATNQHPWCTTQIVDLPASSQCDCGVWWSNSITVAPAALDTMMTPGQEATACASRGFLSSGAYLAQCIQDTTLTAAVRKQCTAMQAAIFGAVPTTPWKQTWCLWNYTMPAAQCATAPGNRLPLCTIECPEHLLKTILPGGFGVGGTAPPTPTTEYCCRDPSDCSVVADTRNCVLGKHADNWYDLSVNFTQPRVAWPDQVCPRNTLWTYTAYPIVTTVAGGAGGTGSAGGTGGASPPTTSGTDLFRARIQLQSPSWFSATYRTEPESLRATPVVTASPDALQYSQARDLCYRDPTQCHGFTVRDKGLYFHSRMPALPDAELRATDPRRAMQFDAESSFHLHRVKTSEVPRRATRMIAVTNAVSYFIERNYGYACASTTFDWRDYLNYDADALARVEQRVMQHFLDAGVSLDLYQRIKYTTSRDAIFRATLVDTAKLICTPDTVNQSPECVNSVLYNTTNTTGMAVTIDYQYGSIGLILDSRGVSGPLLSEHRYKRLFMFNLVAEDVRDGIPLDEYSTVIANLTVKDLADTYLHPNAVPPYVSIESDLVSTVCRNTYNVSTTPAYTGLLTQKSNTFLRRIPIWGLPDGTTQTRVYVYDEVNLDGLFGTADSRKSDGTPVDATLFRDHDSGVAPFVLLDSTTQSINNPGGATTRVGSVDLPDNQVFFIEVSGFGDIYGIYAERDALIRGHLHRGESRPRPNAQCKLNTPLWYDFPYVTSDQLRSPQIQATLALQPLCVVPRCPMPISRSYVWDTGTTRDVKQFPDPDPATVAKDWNSIPCGGHGTCTGPRLLIPETGVCKCDATLFATTDSMDQPTLDRTTGQYHTPYSLQNPACSIDMREGCFDTETNTAGSCANNGMCITKFEGTSQRAACKCGRFPKNCHMTVPRSCERDLLRWETNGFDEAFACNAPRQGCRNSSDYQRPPGAYLRIASYGCEKVRSSSPKAQSTGKCVHDPAVVSQTDGWSCSQCNPGYYGNFCQYLSIQGGCFDSTDLVYKTLTSSGRDTRTTCYYQSEIGQYQTWDWYDPQAFNPVLASSASIFNVSCRGLICSGRGTCSHPTMNDYGKEVYDNPQDPNNLAILNGLTSISTQKAAFQTAVRLSMLNQTCTCQPGFSGAYCQLRECPSPCQNGARCINMNTDSPRCECPRDASFNNILLTSDPLTCGGVVCAGKGTLRKTVSANGAVWTWKCDCFPPGIMVKPTSKDPIQRICSGTALVSSGSKTTTIGSPSSSSSSTGRGGSGGAGSSGASGAHAQSSSSTGGVVLSSTGVGNTTFDGSSSSSSGPNSEVPVFDPTQDTYVDSYSPLYDTAIPLTIVTATVVIAAFQNILPLLILL